MPCHLGKAIPRWILKQRSTNLSFLQKILQKKIYSSDADRFEHELLLLAEKESSKIYDKSELSPYEVQFLTSLLKIKKPNKFLELGVSAGGTTAMFFDILPKKSVMHSVDISSTYYRDKSKAVGYLATDKYDPDQHTKWQLHSGKDISECMDEIGDGIDCVMLDTAHRLPGEFLSFLVVLPYMKDDSILILHDISLHGTYVMNSSRNNTAMTYCTALLFAAIASDKKMLPNVAIPNIGALFIRKDFVMKNINQIMQMLFIPWGYIPDQNIIDNTRPFIEKYYANHVLDQFDAAFQFNKKIRPDKPVR